MYPQQNLVETDAKKLLLLLTDEFQRKKKQNSEMNMSRNCFCRNSKKCYLLIFQ